MFKNYLKIALRTIRHHKANTAINVIGLALGITCCLFIYLWVQDERGMDDIHPNGDRIFTAYSTTIADGKATGSYNTPQHMNTDHMDQLMDDVTKAVPEIKYMAYYTKGYELPWGHPESFSVGDRKVRLKGSRADRDFLRLFGWPMLEGNAATALNEIKGIVISRKMAEMFFGSPANAMGKTIKYENRLDFAVTGVFENVPEQSSLQFDFLFSYDTQKKHLLEYAANEFGTYIRLRDGADVKITEARINSFLQSRLTPQEKGKVSVGLQLFKDQYLHSNFVNGKPIAGRIEYVRLFSGVAIFILLIACINFMNLSTARSAERAREVGVRKVIGSARSALVGQFMIEAVVFALLSMILSLVLLYLLLPAFNSFTGKDIPFPLTSRPFWLTLVTVTLLTGLVSGCYPALYLSSLQPVKTLKGTLRFTSGSIWFRKGLTVFQFVLSIVLIIATIVITKQTSFVQSTHLGYDRENLIYVRIEGDLTQYRNYLKFKEEAAVEPGIAMIDRSTETPHQMEFVVDDAINWEGKRQDQHIGFKPASVGYDFIKVMKMDLASGRDFSPSFSTDSADAFLVNEEAVRQMGMKDPIGKWVSAWKKRGHIIGVLKDYHTGSLKEAILPVMLDVKEGEDFGVILARTKPGQTKEAIASLEKVYKELNPGYAFTYQFADQEYRNLYNSELIISRLSVLFATLAILVSCMGLLGLVLCSAEQRVKEMGIRKILGASLGHIVNIFSRDLLKPVLIAFVIAAPLAGYFMSIWLSDFAYRIDLSWWIFLLGGAAALFIALATISYQAIRTALANPIRSLRAE